MRPTLVPASCATSASTSERELVEFDSLQPPVGKGPVALLKEKEVAKVVGTALVD